jgi:hypothetical protein
LPDGADTSLRDAEQGGESRNVIFGHGPQTAFQIADHGWADADSFGHFDLREPSVCSEVADAQVSFPDRRKVRGADSESVREREEHGRCGLALAAFPHRYRWVADAEKAGEFVGAEAGGGASFPQGSGRKPSYSAARHRLSWLQAPLGLGHYGVSPGCLITDREIYL